MGAEEEGAAAWGGGVRREVMVSGMITAGAEQGHNAEQRLHMSKIRMQTRGKLQKTYSRLARCRTPNMARRGVQNVHTES